MSTEVQKDIQLEIAYVLFIDIVGYSKRLITDQSEQLQKLKRSCREPNSSGGPKPKANYCGHPPSLYGEARQK